VRQDDVVSQFELTYFALRLLRTLKKEGEAVEMVQSTVEI
jgi:hypothetical protein